MPHTNTHTLTYTSTETQLTVQAMGSFKAQVRSWKSRHTENKGEHAGPDLVGAYHKVHSTQPLLQRKG